MLKVNFKKTSDQIGIRLNGIRSNLAKFPDEATTKFKELTPIDTGNARRNTTLRNKTTIVANYPYVERLDKGWSKQARNGMTQPFAAWVQQKAKQIFGK